MPKLVLIPPESLNDALFADFMCIYNDAFSPSEQKSPDDLYTMLMSGCYQFYGVFLQGVLCAFGVVYTSTTPKVALLEYIATSPEQRGKGIGGTLLDFISKNLAEYTIVLEVKSPFETLEDIDFRRLDFYKRHGAKHIENFQYILPLDTGLPPHKMVLLIINAPLADTITTKNLRAMVYDIYQGAYQKPPEDERLRIMFKGLPETLPLM